MAYVEAEAHEAWYQGLCLLAQPRVDPAHAELNSVDNYMAEPPEYNPDWTLPA
jgi:hypothetical protein